MDSTNLNNTDLNCEFDRTNITKGHPFEELKAEADLDRKYVETDSKRIANAGELSKIRREEIELEKLRAKTEREFQENDFRTSIIGRVATSSDEIATLAGAFATVIYGTNRAGNVIKNRQDQKTEQQKSQTEQENVRLQQEIAKQKTEVAAAKRANAERKLSDQRTNEATATKDMVESFKDNENLIEFVRSNTGLFENVQTLIYK